MNKDKKEMTDKLFVVGNGFDRAHDLPTSYADFKKYIGNTIKKDAGEIIDDTYLLLDDIPDTVMPKIHYGIEETSGILADYYQERKVIYWLIDNVAKRKKQMDWNEFEIYLSGLNFNKILSSWEEDDWNVMGLREAVTDISAFFFEWINTIDLSEKCKKEPYSSLIDEKHDFAFSFNYTETLEQLYGMKIDNVCHIHGKREDDKTLQNEKSMTAFGKNNCELIIGFDEKRLNIKKYTGELLGVHTSLIKDTKRMIYNHECFFNKIAKSDIKEIYTIGFSFSAVDMPYIKKICSVFEKNIGTKEMTWYLSDYNSIIKRINFRIKLRKSGFRGKIAKYKM
jgi:hypothetical protein